MTTTDHGAITVLVVDDEEVVHASLRKVLSRRGYQVEAVFSAQEGLERLAERRFDLVITDLMMPEMNGIELMKALRARKVQAPVIMITGYPTIRTAVQAMRLGARDYVSKPFTRKELLGPVTRALRQEDLPSDPGGPGDADGDAPKAAALAPGATVYLSHHSWARFEQDGMFLVGVERTFREAVGRVVEVVVTSAGEMVEQGAVGVRLVNADGEEHGVAMPLTGQVMEVNQAALDPPAITAETWLLRVLPSHLDDEIGNLTLR
jgi:CheY-like chemotaxis protein